MGQAKKRKSPATKAPAPAKRQKTQGKKAPVKATKTTGTKPAKAAPAKAKPKPSKAKAKKTKKATKAAKTKAAKATASKPAAAPAPAPVAPAPPAPAAPAATSPSKEQKAKEMSDEIKKLFRSLAARASAGTKVTAAHLDDCKVNDLKIALKLNDRSTTGNRGDLAKNVAEYINLGSPPRCPKCGGGRLRYKSGKYWCPGYMEDDEFLNCSFTAKDGEVTRNPWQSP